MSSAASSRLFLRRTQFFGHQTPRRYASTAETASSAASKSKEAASNATSKASEGLSRVTSSAGPALSGAAQNVGNAISRIGGRTGKVVAFVESLIPPTVYYSKVGFEITKQVFKGRSMSPPDIATFQKYVEPLLHAIRHPRTTASQTLNSTGATSPSGILNRVRNMSSQQMMTAGVVGAEVLGFFTVGEMIGKMKLVGYHGEVHHEHH